MNGVIRAWMLLSCALLAGSACSAQMPHARPLNSRGVAVILQNRPSQPWSVSGAFSGIRQAKQVVARDQKALAELWKHHQAQGETPVPTVDFKKFDVVAVFAGSKNTGGYSVEIGDIQRKGKTATVQVTIMKPGPGTMTTQAFTYPFAMLAVPKLPQDVKFTIKEVARSDK